MYGDQFREFACWYRESKGYGDNVSFKKNPICIYLPKCSTPTKYSICRKLILLYAPLAFILSGGPEGSHMQIKNVATN